MGRIRNTHSAGARRTRLDTGRTWPARTIAGMRSTPAIRLTAWLLPALVAGCNTVVPTAPGSAPPPTATTEPVTIEHSSMRSRTAVYESALKACKQRGHDQAVFRSQVNEDAQRPPATGPQLSTFVCH